MAAPKKKAAPKKAAKPAKSTPAPAKKAAAKASVPTAKSAVKKDTKPVAKKAAAKKAAEPVAKKAAAKKVAPKKEVPAAEKPAKITKVKLDAVTKRAAKAVAAKAAKASKTKGRKKAAKTPVKKVITERDLRKAKLASKEVKGSAPREVESIFDTNRSTKIPGVANLSSKKEEIVVPKVVKVTKIPKISTTSKEDYDPDFTHSVLDDSNKPTISSTPMLRYSDSELAEFKELILRKLESAKKELHYLQGVIARRDEQGGDNDDGRYMTLEDGSISMEREQLGQMAGRQIQFIDHLEKAMIRIENKTYGICRVTGKLIDKARLRAVPHATLSMEAKLGKVR